MIQVSFFYREDGRYDRFQALGHAGYAKPGEPDILCAAITALATGTIGALQDEVKAPLEYRAEEGAITCELCWESLSEKQREYSDLLIRSLRLACQQVALTYGESYVKVRIQQHKEETLL